MEKIINGVQEVPSSDYQIKWRKAAHFLKLELANVWMVFLETSTLVMGFSQHLSQKVTPPPIKILLEKLFI